MNDLEKSFLVDFYIFMFGGRDKLINSVGKIIFLIVWMLGLCFFGYVVQHLAEDSTNHFFYQDTKIINIGYITDKSCLMFIYAFMFTYWFSFFLGRAYWLRINYKNIKHISSKGIAKYILNTRRQVGFYMFLLFCTIVTHIIICYGLYQNFNFWNKVTLLNECKPAIVYFLSIFIEISFILWRIGVIYKISMIKLAFPEKNIYKDWDKIQLILKDC